MYLHRNIFIKHLANDKCVILYVECRKKLFANQDGEAGRIAASDETRIPQQSAFPIA